MLSDVVEDSYVLRSSLADPRCADRVSAAVVVICLSSAHVPSCRHRRCCRRGDRPARYSDVEPESGRRQTARRNTTDTIVGRLSSPPSPSRHCRSAKFTPSGELDFTIIALLFLCAFGLSIQVVRGAATGRQRNRQDSNRQTSEPFGSAAAVGASKPPDYDYYDYLSARGAVNNRNVGRSYLYSYGTDVGGTQTGRDGGRAGNIGGDGSTPAPTTIKCYSCDYLNDLNHGQGLTSCLDPFVKDNIPPVPTVECAGPCAKIYRKLEGKDDFFLSRNCMPNCKELMRSSEKSSYTECCSYSLCNRAPSGRTTITSSFKFALILTAVTCFVSLVLLK